MPPPGTRLANTPKGRALIATRNFAAGEPIATFDKPLLALPDSNSMRTTCNYCLRTDQSNANAQPLRACSRCKAAVYCDEACQRAHWKAAHKVECSVFVRVRDRAGKDWLPTSTRAVAQVLLLMRAGNPAISAAFGHGGSLRGNVEAYKRDADLWEGFKLQSMAAIVYSGLPETEEQLATAAEVLCKIQTNAFDRMDADTGKAGIYVDAELSMVNHSCIPNAFVAFDKRTAILRARRPIAGGDEIEICYIDNTQPRSVRQHNLRLYDFQCACPRCQDDLDVYQVCAMSPNIPLNVLSLQPDLSKLRDPPIDRSLISSTTIETSFKACVSCEIPETLRDLKQYWKLCRDLIRAGMWAVNPVIKMIRDAVDFCKPDNKTLAYAVSMQCFIATECEPFMSVAPFMPMRIRNLWEIADLLGFTMDGSAEKCPFEPAADVLARADLLSMHEAMLRLVVHYGPIGATEEWNILQMAKEALAEVEKVQGRERQLAMLRTWIRDPNDPEAASFFRENVLKPINELAALAPAIMDMLFGDGAVTQVA
ncbi:hypothetical protein QBC47DRAFT_376838 [Echria macrotheca]|uniref:MYND-type zinc finger protein samB n=1 Tax=Echria macrotheca TaxID=438768 RepID=A0AAJ0FBW0_9PEZI|nr:hypothetical protein QBC47DRAFT_376838 [Echria macrotheca]